MFHIKWGIGVLEILFAKFLKRTYSFVSLQHRPNLTSIFLIHFRLFLMNGKKEGFFEEDNEK